MKFPFTISKFSKINLSPLELFILAVFVIYIIFPIETPAFIAQSVTTPISMMFMFLITVYLFIYVSPILGVVYIFVAYELLRRSSSISISAYKPIINYTPTSLNSKQRDQNIVKMNRPVMATLEEEMVQIHAPIGVSEKTTYIDGTFKPVSENIHNAFGV